MRFYDIRNMFFKFVMLLLHIGENPNAALMTGRISLRECLRILANAAANLTNVLRIKQQHNTCVAYLHIHIAGLMF